MKEHIKNSKRQLLPAYKSIFQLNKMVIDSKIPGTEPFLQCFRIPAQDKEGKNVKRRLREQLKRVGIHYASLFPELDYQAKYITAHWMERIGEPD